MKNLTKIFMAVVAGMFAFSCVTDTTVDQTVDLGIEANGEKAKTVLSVSIADSEELRTQLGVAGDAGYPMYWSNGDQISVNGVASNALKLEEGEQTTAAEFGFGASLNTPYCIAYPAAAEGQVKFAANQSHAGNSTFGDKVAAMWGYSEDGDAHLNHLTGVLKIGVVVDEAVGEKKLVYAQVSTIDRTPIAGDFKFDFAKGELGEAVAATEVISYSFGEGVVLDAATPTYLHIAVPAGKYDELYVTLYDENGGVMYATVKAGDNNKPLAAGKVREFKKDGVEQLITYAPNAEVFVVREAKDLVTLSQEVAKGEFLKDVLFVADVDMAKLPEGVTYKDFTLDTRRAVDGKPVVSTIHGNGYAVKNLTTPLFNELYANVKGLHLRDVNINETVNPQVGSLARRVGNYTKVDNITYPTVVENCTATGTINVNCPEMGLLDSRYDPYSTGGMMGVAYGTTLRKLTTDVDITIEQVMASSAVSADKSNCNPCIGGVVGNTGDAGSAYLTHFIDLENKGDIVVKDATWTSTPTVSTSGSFNPKSAIGYMVGGIVASSPTALGKATIQNLTNRGNISVEGGNYGCFYFGGIAAQMTTNTTKKDSNNKSVINTSGNTATNLNNYGDITFKNCNIRNLEASGCVGHAPGGSRFSQLNNYGNISLEASAFVISTVVGGTMGWHANADIGTVTENSGHAAMVDCSNSGTISVKSKSVGEHTNDGEFFYRIGGVAAWSQALMVRCNNNAGGDITSNATLFYNRAGEHMCSIGGVVGYKTINYVENSKNAAAISANINITKGSNSTNDQACVNLGGAIGYAPLIIRYCENSGAVSLVANVPSVKLGGVGGHITVSENNSNSGAVSLDGTFVRVILGGILGYSSQYSSTVYSKNNSNSGAVNFGTKAETSVTGNLSLGGGIGYVNLRARYITNSGAVTVNVKKVDGIASIGGVTGETNNTTSDNGYVEGFSNSGAVTVNGTFNDETMIGGALGYDHSSLGKHTNTGNITLQSTAVVNGRLLLGGVVGYNLYSIGDDGNYLTNGTEDAKNQKGNITVNGTINNYAAIGGVTGSVIYSQTNLFNSKNYGKVTVALTSTTDEIYVGGVAGYVDSTRRPFTALGITNDALDPKNNSTRMQYSTGGDKRPHLKNCHNYGSIEYTGNANCGPLSLGGVVGFASGNITTATNNGTVTVKGTMTKSSLNIVDQTGHTHIGGVVGTGLCGYKTSFTYDGLTNNAEVKLDNVVFSGSDNNYFGGLIGYAHEYVPYSLAETTEYATGYVTNTTTSNGKVSLTKESSWREITVKNSCNKGKVTVANTSESTKSLHVGGVGGWLGHLTENTTNEGKIDAKVNTTQHLRLGGIAWQIKGASTDICNKGDIEIKGTIGGSLYVGGVIGNKNNYARTRSNNEGDIYIGTESEGATIGYSTTGNCFVGGFQYDGADSGTQEIVDSYNKGHITLSSKSKVKNGLRLAGLVAKVEHSGILAVNGFTNYGNITCKGAIEGETFLAGMVGQIVKGYVIVKEKGFKNTGKLEHAGSTYTHAANPIKNDFVVIAGCIACCNGAGYLSHASSAGKVWTGTVENSGEIVYSGKSKTSVVLAGIFGAANSNKEGAGSSEYAFPLQSAKYISTGNITCTGTYNTNASGDRVGQSRIGAILGNTNRGTSAKPIIIGNATVNCKITAWGFTHKGNNQNGGIGMLSGLDRVDQYLVAKNCKVAGTIDRGYYGLITDKFGNDVEGWTEEPVALKADNFYNYLWSTAVDASVAQTDTCSFYTAE